MVYTIRSDNGRHALPMINRNNHMDRQVDMTTYNMRQMATDGPRDASRTLAIHWRTNQFRHFNYARTKDFFDWGIIQIFQNLVDTKISILTVRSWNNLAWGEHSKTKWQADFQFQALHCTYLQLILSSSCFVVGGISTIQMLPWQMRAMYFPVLLMMSRSTGDDGACVQRRVWNIRHCD